MRKRMIIILVILTILIILLILLGEIPIKKAVKIDEYIKKDENAYLCEYVATTGPDWRGYNLKTKESERVYLIGNTPMNKINKRVFFHFSDNKYLIKGEVVGKKIISESGDIAEYYFRDGYELDEIKKKYSEPYEVFDIIKVVDWDIISPIDRSESLRFFAPKEFLNIYDYIF